MNSRSAFSSSFMFTPSSVSLMSTRTSSAFRLFIRISTTTVVSVWYQSWFTFGALMVSLWTAGTSIELEKILFVSSTLFPTLQGVLNIRRFDVRHFGFTSLGIRHQSSIYDVIKFRLTSFFYPPISFNIHHFFSSQYPSKSGGYWELKKWNCPRQKNWFAELSFKF